MRSSVSLLTAVGLSDWLIFCNFTHVVPVFAKTKLQHQVPINRNLGSIPAYLFFCRTLVKRYTSFVSILISSLLFGIVHLNPWSFINGIGIGIFSGWVYFKTRSVLPSIIIHASVNLSGFLLRLFVDIPSLINKWVSC